MICTKCNNEGVLNTVMGQQFYYCRTCKDEIKAEERKPVTNHIKAVIEKMYAYNGGTWVATKQPDDAFEAVKDWYDFKVGDTLTWDGKDNYKVISLDYKTGKSELMCLFDDRFLSVRAGDILPYTFYNKGDSGAQLVKRGE